MFQVLISPIFRCTRLCVTACGIMHPRCCRSIAWKRSSSASRLPAGVILVYYTTSCNTQSSAPEDERDQRPKHVELIGIINKPLLLHLVSYLHHLSSYMFRPSLSHHEAVGLCRDLTLRCRTTYMYVVPHR